MDQYDFDNIVTGTTFGTALDSTTEFLLYCLAWETMWSLILYVVCT